MPGRERFAWIMFALSGLIFMIVGYRAGDWLTILGAVVWLVGCGAFLSNA